MERAGLVGDYEVTRGSAKDISCGKCLVSIDSPSRSKLSNKPRFSSAEYTLRALFCCGGVAMATGLRVFVAMSMTLGRNACICNVEGRMGAKQDEIPLVTCAWFVF
jgi:hypothetical protein